MRSKGLFFLALAVVITIVFASGVWAATVGSTTVVTTGSTTIPARIGPFDVSQCTAIRFTVGLPVSLPSGCQMDVWILDSNTTSANYQAIILYESKTDNGQMDSTVVINPSILTSIYIEMIQSSCVLSWKGENLPYALYCISTGGS